MLIPARDIRLLIQINQPDVTVLHWIAMVLQQDRTRQADVAATTGWRVVFSENNMFVDQNTVVPHADPGWLRLFPIYELG